jgi:beta-1,4-N-acetylglucosaminyltransferase
MPSKVKYTKVFATVGTTRFDSLVSALLEPRVLAALSKRGAEQLTVQHGSSPWPSNASNTSELRVNGYDYKKDIGADMKGADLVISHAGKSKDLALCRQNDATYILNALYLGSGSILEALRAGKPLIVVVNETLADNHQAELAEELAEQGFLVWCLPRDLERKINEADFKGLRPFGVGDPSGFQAILDEEMWGSCGS